jgi:hypothetical protein
MGRRRKRVEPRAVSRSREGKGIQGRVFQHWALYQLDELLDRHSCVYRLAVLCSRNANHNFGAPREFRNFPSSSKQGKQGLSQAGLHHVTHGRGGEGYLDGSPYQASKPLELQGPHTRCSCKPPPSSLRHHARQYWPRSPSWFAQLIFSLYSYALARLIVLVPHLEACLCLVARFFCI